MEALILEGTDNTPKIHFDAQNYSFELSGESRPEDVRKFYDPILAWLDQFNSFLHFQTKSATDIKEVAFAFKLEYFNSSSAKYIMDVMSKLSDIQKNCSNVSIIINWFYDEMDEDMKEAGEEFQKITNIPFKYHVTN